jgi:hypothetical protein
MTDKYPNCPNPDEAGEDESGGMPMLRRAESILAGNPVPISSPLVATKGPAIRGMNPSGVLAGLLIPRKTSRSSNERREARHYQLTDFATIACEHGECDAKVINMSERGLALEAVIEVKIGDHVEVLFEGFEPIDGRVVWRRDSRMGIDLGEPKIDLQPAH